MERRKLQMERNSLLIGTVGVTLLGWTDREEWGRAGHVARNWQFIEQENILVGGEEKKIPRGRPRQRWHHINTTPIL